MSYFSQPVGWNVTVQLIKHCRKKYILDLFDFTNYLTLILPVIFQLRPRISFTNKSWPREQKEKATGLKQAAKDIETMNLPAFSNKTKIIRVCYQVTSLWLTL